MRDVYVVYLALVVAADRRAFARVTRGQPLGFAGAAAGLASRIDVSRARFATTSRLSARATSGSATDMIPEKSTSIVAVRRVPSGIAVTA